MELELAEAILIEYRMKPYPIRLSCACWAAYMKPGAVHPPIRTHWLRIIRLSNNCRFHTGSSNALVLRELTQLAEHIRDSSSLQDMPFE